MQPRHVRIGDITVGNDLPLALIAGPCAMESRAHALEMSARAGRDHRQLGIGLIYKTSFDKANRTSSAARAVSAGQGLPIFAEIRETLRLPGIDRRARGRAMRARRPRRWMSADPGLSVPADRPADRRRRRPARAVNVKKGQFLAPWDMQQRRRQARRHRQRAHPAVRARRQLRLQHAGLRHALAAGAGRDRLPGGVRRDPFGAAAGRAGRPRGGERRSCRSGARRGRGRRRRRLHGNPRGPRPRALRRPQHGPARRTLPALLETLIAFDRLAKARAANQGAR